jgi:hypothetical protein
MSQLDNDRPAIDLLGAAAAQVRAEREQAIAEGDLRRGALLTQVSQAIHRALVTFDELTVV